MILALIAFGGAIGSISRYLLGGFVQRSMHVAFPFGTLAVNILGCLAIGVIYRSLPPIDPHGSNVSALLIVGFCGGFTTFSTFSLETVGLLAGGDWLKAALYVALSVFVCLAATGVGLRIGSMAR